MHGYEVLRKLADGSAAEVFLARNESSRDRVVLEVIRPELTTDSEVYGRFLDRAKERQQLSHPNLLRRAWTGCAKNGRLFVVTEPIAGEHLGSWLSAHGPLSPEEMVKLLLPVCDALEYLHARGLVHGNLRPSNVFLAGPSGNFSPKLLDTGLSLFRSSRAINLPKSMVLVEPEYLAPERVRGQRGNALSDVYGLGVLLYQSLTGRPPFQNDDPAETRRLHLETEPPPLPPSCSRLEPVILRCLHKVPAQRYPSAAAVRQALARCLPSALPLSLPAPPAATAAAAAEVRPPLEVVQPPTELGGHVAPPNWETVAGPGRVTIVSPADEQEAQTLVVGTPVGEVLGNYELLDLLGQGGMGRVFLAQHTKLGRKVAIKILRRELASDATQLQRFFQEAQAVNRVSHENIVEIYDFVEEKGGPVYCVMEPLTGQSLKDLAKKGPIPIRRLVHICRQVADALHAAHRVGVVHRDVKPDNIFLIEKNGKPDFVKVLDFGVAKLTAVAESVNSTRSGMVVGTPAYMAPEQALGDNIDHRADIYALATVLYTGLAGRHPFDATALGPLVAKLVTQPAPPLPGKSASGEVIPAGLRAVIERCLAKRPNDRLRTMAELSAALAPFDGEAFTTPAPRQPEQPPVLPRSRRRTPARGLAPRRVRRTLLRKRWMIAACLGLVLASAGAWFGIGWKRARDAAKPPDDGVSTVRTAEDVNAPPRARNNGRGASRSTDR
jgi:serine/threonine protein kinase